MGNPKISVIIPCYNVSEYVDRCIQSIVSQSIGMEYIEIICVDDASADDTVEKLLIWEQKYSDNIIVVRSETNGRQGAARNIGLGYASGEWVAFVDSDDWVEPDYLERLYEKAVADDSDIVCCETGRDFHKELYCYTAEERSTQKDTGCVIIDSAKRRQELIIYNQIPFKAYSRIIRREILLENEILFPEGVVYEDIYWGSLLNYYVGKVSFVGLKLYHYFVNEKSTVLAKAESYHTDMLTVNSMLWRELTARGFMEKYRAEIEYEFFYTCILAFVKVIAWRFEEPPYSLYRLLGAFATDYVPDPYANKYFGAREFPEVHKLILEGVYMGMDRDSFTNWVENIKRIGI